MTTTRTTTGEHLRPVAEGDAPQTATRDDVSDPALLPQLMRLIAGELRDLGAKVAGQVLPALKRIEERQIDDAQHVDTQVQRLHARIDELQTQLAGAK